MIERIFSWIYSHSFFSFIVLVMILMAFASRLSTFSRDGSIEGFLGANDPAIIQHQQYKRQFGSDSDIVLLVQSDSIFSHEFLQRIATLHNRILTEVPYVEDITSLYNARNSLGDENSFRVENLLEPMPKSSQELELLRETVLENPLYKGVLVNEDESSTTLVIKPDRFASTSKALAEDDSNTYLNLFDNEAVDETPRESITPEALAEMVSSIRSIVQSMDEESFRISMSGSPVASTEIVRLMSQDMPKFARMSLLLIFVGLIVMTRKVSFVVLPILVIVASLISVFGTMSVMGVPLKPPTQMLLSIIIVGGVCITTHLLSVFFRLNETGLNKAAAVLATLNHCFLPIVFTSVTTGMGLLALSSSVLAPIKELGIYGAVASLAVLFYGLVFTTLYLRLYRFWKKDELISSSNSDDSNTRLERLIFSTSLWSIAHEKLILTILFVVTIVSLYGASRINVSHNALLWLSPQNKVRVDTSVIDRTFHNTISLEVIFSRENDGSLRNESDLRNIAILSENLTQLSEGRFEVGKSLSIADIAKEVNKTLNGNHESSFEIPADDQVANTFLLFENSGSDDLEYFANEGYTKVRMTVRLPWMEAFEYQGFIERLRAEASKIMGPEVDVVLTGIMPILAKTSASVISSMIASYGLSFITILVAMVVALKSIPLGLASLLPNMLPIIVGLGFMGAMGVSLDTFTLTIGSIALGLVVDDTIHFFHTFKKQSQSTDDFPTALRHTTQISGKPIFITSFVLIAGFLMYMQSSLYNVRGFGLVMVVIVVFALVCELILSPIIVKRWYVAMRVARKTSDTNKTESTRIVNA